MTTKAITVSPAAGTTWDSNPKFAIEQMDVPAAFSSICPMCGQPLLLAPAPFVVLVRVNGEPFRLADPLHIGGRKIYADGRNRWLKIVPIVQVQR
jgi:hypothetical protein